MNIVPSILQVKNSDAPTLEEVAEALQLVPHTIVDVEDGDRYWRNDEVTVVIQIPTTLTFHQHLQLLYAITHVLRPDEYDDDEQDNFAILRLQWGN